METSDTLSSIIGDFENVLKGIKVAGSSSWDGHENWTEYCDSEEIPGDRQSMLRAATRDVEHRLAQLVAQSDFDIMSDPGALKQIILMGFGEAVLPSIIRSSSPCIEHPSLHQLVFDLINEDSVYFLRLVRRQGLLPQLSWENWAIVKALAEKHAIGTFQEILEDMDPPVRITIYEALVPRLDCRTFSQLVKKAAQAISSKDNQELLAILRAYTISPNLEYPILLMIREYGMNSFPLYASYLLQHLIMDAHKTTNPALLNSTTLPSCVFELYQRVHENANWWKCGTLMVSTIQSLCNKQE